MLAQASPLRDDISTDEITPVAILSHYDDKLARYAHTGFKAGNELPIGVNAIFNSGIEVIVAGNRYGKGSSREHSPASEKLAGVKLVIARSFDRLYRQNADNIGLLTSTDFGLVDRIAAGEEITLDELVADRDTLAQAILKSGGLLRFGQTHLTSVDVAPTPKASHGQTYFEKIIARHALISPWTNAQNTAATTGSGTFVRADWRFIHEYYTGMAAHYALPGQVVVGTDSHTPHSGALGCAAFGVGTTDMANAFVTGAVRMTVPQMLKVELNGPLAIGITAKDIVLHLLAREDIKAGLGVGKVFEFNGSAITSLSIDERATLTNMTAELGGLTGIFAPDAQTQAFLRERRGVDFVIEPWMHSDADAHFDSIISIDCAGLTPMVASPGDPGNGLALSQLKESVKVDIAYGGSCTAGKREDFDHYHAVLAWAVQHGLSVPKHVKLYLQYGTTAVRDYCIAKGYDKTFAQVGAQILQPSCGACANCGPGSSSEVGQVTISAINRNFPGRSGPGQVWLASPPTVMASALAGELMSFEHLQTTFANASAVS